MGASKKSRTAPNLDALTPEDRQACERVARILQHPISEWNWPTLTPSSDIQWTTTASQPSSVTASTALNPWPDLRREIRPFEDGNILRFEDSNAPSGGFAGEYRPRIDSSHHGFSELRGGHMSEWGAEPHVHNLYGAVDFPMSQLRNLSNTTDASGDSDIRVMTGQSFDSLAAPDHMDRGHHIDYPGHLVDSTLANMSDNNSDQTGPLSTDDTYWLSDQQDCQDSYSRFNRPPSNDSSSWTFVEENQEQEYEEVPKELEIVAVQWIANQPLTQDSAPSRQQRRRRSFQNQHLREETGKTRQLKACVRCKMQKVRCQLDENNPTGDCQTCKDVSTQKIHTLGCYRYKISEVTLYRTGKAPGLEFTFRWPKMTLKDISKWQNSEVRTIKVLSDVCPVPLELSARMFEPIPQDSRKKSWMDGKTKKYKDTTPFAILNMSAAVKDMTNFIDSTVEICLRFFMETRDAFAKDTYLFAWNYMKTRAVSSHKVAP